jgi:hypothetical protein
MKKLFIINSIFIFALMFTINAQTVYEPLTNDIYGFLDRLSQKGVISQLNDQIRPLARSYIAEKLKEVSLKDSLLTPLEKEELSFYKEDFYNELNWQKANDGKINIACKDAGGRLRLFSYSDSLFKINLSPILGLSLGTKNSNSANHLWNGAYFYGYFSNWLGFSFDFRDNTETGAGIDVQKQFTPEPGASIIVDNNQHIEYSKIQATLAASWSWGTFTVGQQNMEWGYGESGLLVLSQKAPPFPIIQLDINPVSWLRFNYFHAWLLSNVIDSNETYRTLSDLSEQQYRVIYRSKYLASHTLIITPLKGLDVSLGESIVYSDKLEAAYLFPLMFFRAEDHYLSNNANSAGGNSQFFLGVSSRDHLKNTHLYGTWFIDEITFEGITNSYTQRNQFGFTLGGAISDIPITNLTATLEYTKIYPFVYHHYIQTQTYESDSYVMGDWMGANADLIYFALNYRIIRGLQLKLWTQYIRKGSDGTVDQQYTQPQPPFLFGLRTNYTYWGLDCKYEIIHELFGEINMQFNSISSEQNDHSFKDNGDTEISFSVYYGL